MAEKAPCSCGCGKLVSASTDHCHHARKTTPCTKATCLAGTTIPLVKLHQSCEKSPPRKQQKTNSGPLPPLEIQDRGTIHMSSSGVNDVPPMANTVLDMETLDPPQPPLSPVYSETEGIEPVVNPCTEAWTNTSHYRATVEDATLSRGQARLGQGHFCWPLTLALRAGPLSTGPGLGSAWPQATQVGPGLGQG